MIEKLKLNYLNQSLHQIQKLKHVGSKWFESNALVSNLKFDDQIPSNQLAYTLHTIKGGAAVLEFESIRMFAQQAEGFSKSDIDFSKAYLMIQHIEKLLQNELNKLQSFSSSTTQYSAKDLKSIFEELAKRVGKDVVVEIDDSSFILAKLKEEFVFQVIFPILLNAIDHGVETFEERLSSGKFFLAQVRLEISYRNDEVLFMFADDGRGQSSKSVCAFSGGGLGLEIVKNLIGNLHGTLSFESTKKNGTFVLISIPKEHLQPNTLSEVA